DGTLTSSWSMSGAAISLTVTVPMGMAVSVSLPNAPAGLVFEDGSNVPASQSGNRAVVTGVGSGTHVFTLPTDLALKATVSDSSTVEDYGWDAAQLTDGKAGYVS